MPAGWGTGHRGFGTCKVHGGSWKRVEEAWRVAIQVAGEYEISPWEALTLTVRLAAQRVAWVDAQLRDAVSAADGDVSGSAAVRRWLRESRLERAQLGRTAKAAIDAGVAERLVRQVELEGRLLAEALARALDALDLDPDQRLRALEAAHEHLLGADADTPARELPAGTGEDPPSAGPRGPESDFRGGDGSTDPGGGPGG